MQPEHENEVNETILFHHILHKTQEFVGHKSPKYSWNVCITVYVANIMHNTI